MLLSGMMEDSFTDMNNFEERRTEKLTTIKMIEIIVLKEI